MHNINRTQMEMEWEADPFSAGEYAYDEYEYETYPELEGEMYDEGYGEFETEFDSPFSEAEEMELAAQFLEITDEAELEQFLGDLFRKASRVVGRVIRSPVGRALGGMLRGVARKALPIAGGALGSFFGGPAGGAIGSQLASTAGRMFGLELEGLSPEDQEFEVARRFVRLAGDAARQAAAAPATASPQAVARQAMAAAAQRQAPGLVTGGSALPTRVGLRRPRRQGGRWIRRGRTIVLMGV